MGEYGWYCSIPDTHALVADIVEVASIPADGMTDAVIDYEGNGSLEPEDVAVRSPW